MKKIITILFLLIGLISNSQLSSIVIRNDTTFSFNPSTGVYTQLNKFWPTDSVPLRTAIGLGTGLAYGTTAQYLRGNFSLATFPTTTASFANSTNKNFVTDAQLVIIGNTSGSNSGDNAANSTYASDYRAANFVAGTAYLAPSGNGSALTGLTASQVSLGNVTNESKATMFASPTFTGVPVLPTPFTIGAVSMTATGTQLNYLNAATGTSGTTNTNILFSGTPTIVTPSFTTGFTIGGAAASGKIPIGNGTNYVASTPTYPNAASTINKVIKSDGTNFVTSTETWAVPGTTGNLLISDGTNWTSAVRYPIQVATADIAATASATSTTTIFTPTADGMYRVSVYLKITTTGTSPVAGPVTITYTDADGSVAQSHVMLLANTSGAVVTTTVNNTTTTGTVYGSIVMNAKSGVAIQYAIAVSGTFGSGRYTAHLTCERIK